MKGITGTFLDEITYDIPSANWGAVAFQDGYVAFAELPEYLEIDNRLARKHGIQSWSNVESFERGMPLNFLPIDWRNLRRRWPSDLGRAAGSSPNSSCRRDRIPPPPSPFSRNGSASRRNPDDQHA